MGDAERMSWTTKNTLLAGLVVAAIVVAGWFILGGDRGRSPAARPAVAGAATAERPAERGVGGRADAGEPTAAASEPAGPDRRILERTLAGARAARLDTLPLGEIVMRVGRRFVGTPYVANTLDSPGPERLVINLRALDCVTFVENTLAIARMVRAGEDDFDTFAAELRRMRYRSGAIDGYPSRLHYFSEWVADNERKGLVRDVTREIGGVRSTEPIDFMSTNADAYPKLAEGAHRAAIERIEERLSREARWYIPQDRIADVAPSIRSGDIIAATSSIEGLDVAHTGIAVRVDGRLHLLHAPLVGDSVQISEVPLADRVRRIDGQDGIMVIRPV